MSIISRGKFYYIANDLLMALRLYGKSGKTKKFRDVLCYHLKTMGIEVEDRKAKKISKLWG